MTDDASSAYTRRPPGGRKAGASHLCGDMNDSERVTLRLSVQDLQALDLFVGTGEFANRSEVIRQAIKDFVRNHAPKVVDGMNARKQLQDTFLQMQNLKAQLEEQQKLLEKLMRQ